MIKLFYLQRKNVILIFNSSSSSSFSVFITQFYMVKRRRKLHHFIIMFITLSVTSLLILLIHHTQTISSHPTHNQQSNHHIPSSLPPVNIHNRFNNNNIRTINYNYNSQPQYSRYQSTVSQPPQPIQNVYIQLLNQPPIQPIPPFNISPSLNPPSDARIIRRSDRISTGGRKKKESLTPSRPQNVSRFESPHYPWGNHAFGPIESYLVNREGLSWTAYFNHETIAVVLEDQNKLVRNCTLLEIM